MSKFGLMVDRRINPRAIPILVDLGYVDDKAARDRGDAMIAAGIAGRNFSIEGNRRLLVKVPPRKADVLKSFPIVAGETYFMATHHWRGLRDGEKVARVPR